MAFDGKTSSPTVIIFGPTGGVGSAAARAANEHGAKVVLAMRDPEKAIPGLSPEQEREGGFERVYADLTKPETVHAAVTKTGASRAFIYLIFRTSDHMKSSLVALKSAGIGFVGFLSSITVPDDLNDLSPGNFIPWGHGQVEIALDQVFGTDNFIAFRPGFFDSNALRWKEMAQKGDIKIAYPEAQFDWISPDDIGRVCGAILAKDFRGHDGNALPGSIRLCGPELMSQHAAATTIVTVLGKDIKITELDEQGGVESFMETAHLPEPAARHMVNMLKDRVQSGFSDPNYEGSRYEEAVANIQKYGGRPPTTFSQWVSENRVAFGG
ncbi:hypothetical protein H2200_001476 [Cladophialophora chaetospira]|uniref:NmrA-like domain-containing protein n=1 Tax=Cladophialophora chaetospira TaxID=386627 RepID=A0AA39CP37_9EURO|nr:hypothetical protein H2200_001476 [Cladophialophora chaetospira]